MSQSIVRLGFNSHAVNPNARSCLPAFAISGNSNGVSFAKSDNCPSTACACFASHNIVWNATDVCSKSIALFTTAQALAIPASAVAIAANPAVIVDPTELKLPADFVSLSVSSAVFLIAADALSFASRSMSISDVAMFDAYFSL